jgi:hypothetical protein
LERAKTIFSKGKAPPARKTVRLTAWAGWVLIGAVETPGTPSAKGFFPRDFQKAWSANSGLFHFFGVPISSNISGLVDLRSGGPQAPQRNSDSPIDKGPFGNVQPMPANDEP